VRLRYVDISPSPPYTPEVSPWIELDKHVVLKPGERVLNVETLTDPFGYQFVRLWIAEVGL